VSCGNLLIGLLLAVSSPPAATPSNEQLLDQAEAAYAAGLHSQKKPLAARQLFARAAGLYEQLRSRGVRNPSLERNLGQSYLLAGDSPRAILAYRRGLDMAPDDPALRTRLDEAREQVLSWSGGPFGRPRADNWPPWLPRVNAALLLAFVVTLYSAACVFFTLHWLTRQGKYLALAGLTFAAAVGLGVSLIFEERTRTWERDHPIVVIAADKVVLHKGDGSNYPWYDAATRDWQDVHGPIPADAPALPRGAEARLRFRRAAWVQIELAGGEIGWVRRADVVFDCAD
jgi:hypothetical protein